MDQAVFRDRYVKVESIEEGMKKVLDEDFAFVWAPASLQHHTSESCTYIEVEVPVFSTQAAFIFAKGLTAAPIIDNM